MKSCMSGDSLQITHLAFTTRKSKKIRSNVQVTSYIEHAKKHLSKTTTWITVKRVLVMMLLSRANKLHLFELSTSHLYIAHFMIRASEHSHNGPMIPSELLASASGAELVPPSRIVQVSLSLFFYHYLKIIMTQYTRRCVSFLANGHAVVVSVRLQTLPGIPPAGWDSEEAQNG
jgi:hypothetical protein